MSEEGPVHGAGAVSSLKEYERKLRASMKLMERATRDNVIREIVAGVEEQVRAGGGDFTSVAPALDDPRWVGVQMVKVYGISPGFKALYLALSAFLAALSVPGVLSSDPALATVPALVGFAALVVTTYVSVGLVSSTFALVLAGLAAGVRIALFVVPLREVAPIDLASSGEASLFMVATGMLVLVAALPALASRAGAEEE